MSTENVIKISFKLNLIFYLYLSQKNNSITQLLICNKLCSYFDNYRVADFARSGNVCQQTVMLDEGPIPEFSHSMEPQLRQLGLPTCLQKGENCSWTHLFYFYYMYYEQRIILDCFVHSENIANPVRLLKVGKSKIHCCLVNL